MTTYAIGDVQGCYVELMALLEKIEFAPKKDRLWFAGDLINRGPCSLDVLRFVKSLGDKHITVLGNHDLHLLALHYGVDRSNRNDTLAEILQARDKIELIEWLRHRPLLYRDRETDFVIVHAGLAPSWGINKAENLAGEVEQALQETPHAFLHNMYGNQPDYWRDDLVGIERLRCIVNYLTRMRFCYPDGRLDLSYKGDIAGKPPGLIPWFQVSDRQNAKQKIIFGHWAALGGQSDTPNIYPLDTGCVWGNCLTAMRIPDTKRFTVRCE